MVSGGGPTEGGLLRSPGTPLPFPTLLVLIFLPLLSTKSPSMVSPLWRGAAPVYLEYDPPIFRRMGEASPDCNSLGGVSKFWLSVEGFFEFMKLCLF